MINSWKVIESEKVFESPFITLYKENLEKPDGKIAKDFYSVKRRDAAFVVALTSEREVVLVSQYKNGIKEVIWEIPAGYIEADEEPIAAAQRELLEETGYVGAKIESLGKFVPNPAISPNRNHVFLSSPVKFSTKPKFDENEEIEVKLFSLAELVKDIKNRQTIFIDTQSQLALLLTWEKFNKWNHW